MKNEKNKQINIFSYLQKHYGAKNISENLKLKLSY